MHSSIFLHLVVTNTTFMQKFILTFIVQVIVLHTVLAQNWNQNMRISKYNVEVIANQFMANTIIELEFCNDTKSEAETRFNFQLNPNQAVTHFQLMLGDTYRDGSIEERWKATQAYNAVVGKRIDPALLQKNYGNTYTLNVYPVPAGGCRKVKIFITERLKQLNDSLIYELPLSCSNSVDFLNVKFNTQNQVLPITKGILANKKLESQSIQTSLDKQKSLTTSLYVPMRIQNNIACLEKNDTAHHVAIRLNKLSNQFQIQKPKNLIVYWDLSLGTLHANKQNYINFLQQVMTTSSISSVTVVGFNHQIMFTQTYDLKDLKKLVYKLQGTEHIGRCDLGLVNNYNTDFELVLVFSRATGFYTNTNQQPKTFTQLVYDSSLATNQLNIDQLIKNTGGGKVALNSSNTLTAVQKTLTAHFTVKGVKLNGKDIDFQLIDSTNTKHITIAFFTKQPITEIEIDYGVLGQLNKISFLKHQICNAENISYLLKLNEYENLNTIYRRYYSSYNWARSLIFGREHRIVTEQTAYIVLERIEDYINFGITPPKEIEQQVINDPRYVKAQWRDPYIWQQNLTEQEAIQHHALNYNSKYAKYGHLQFKSKEAIAMDKIKIEKETNSTVLRSSNTNQDISDDKKSLESEVIVTGYGSAKKRMMMTASSSVIYRNGLQGFTDLSTALQGRVAGVQVTGSTGTPGSSIGITLRGAATINKNAPPLYILDGAPIDQDYALSTLNVSTLSYISVLNGNNASILYGSRGANGVIIMETNKGSYKKTWSRYNLYDMEDEDYLNEMQDESAYQKRIKYNELQKTEGHNINFYLDMGTYFAKLGETDFAKEILYSGYEIATTNAQRLSIGYAFDEIGLYKEAQLVYTNLLQNANRTTDNGNYYFDYDYFYNGYDGAINEQSLYRNIAISNMLLGNWQNAADNYYKAISNSSKNGTYYYSNYEKGNTVLLEFQALLNAQKGYIDTTYFQLAFNTKYLPSKHFTIESSNFYGNYTLKKIGSKDKEDLYVSNNGLDYNIDQLTNNRFELSIQANNYYNQSNMVRVIEFSNFGKSNQAISIKNHNLTNQYGDVIMQVLEN